MILIQGKTNSLNLDARELKALLAYRGKTDSTRKIVIRATDKGLFATARNGIGAALYIRGTVLGDENYDWDLDATPLTQIKFGLDDTISIALTSGGNLGKVTVKPPSDTAEGIEFFSLEKHCSTQLPIDRIIELPAPPDCDLHCPYTVPVDWGTFGMISGLTKLACTNHVEIYTPHCVGEPIYVEIGRKRDEGGTNWFATFMPWQDDEGDEQQLNIDDQADPAGGDEE
jgi:hypothetical protein